jgi:ribose-phosphate pyrophosphokinase
MPACDEQVNAAARAALRNPGRTEGNARLRSKPTCPDLFLFAGTANPALAQAVAQELGVRPGNRVVNRFPDGEIRVRLEESVRGRHVFLVQPTAPPVNDHLMELMAFADVCRRCAAARITTVISYFGYARADKRHSRREPITASLVAQLMQSAGVDHVITLDLHAAQIEGFFQIPVDCLTAVPTLCHALKPRLPADVVVVSPDTGRVAMAIDYAHRLGSSAVVLHKRRASGTETEVTHVVGDVRDRPCLIIDDMISTGGTIARAVEALLGAGARPHITIAATHGLFVGDAGATLNLPSIQEIYVTDSVAAKGPWPRLTTVSIAPLLAAAIRQVMAGASLGDLFQDVPWNVWKGNRRTVQRVRK